MAQTTGRDTAHGEKAAEAAADVTKRIQQETEAALDKARKSAEEMTSPMLRLVLDRSTPAMREIVEKESELASFWFETGRAQLEHTMETMRHLAEAQHDVEFGRADLRAFDEVEIPLAKLGSAPNA